MAQIQVAGIGRISALPDLGLLHMNIRQTAPTATEALQASAAVTREAVDVLRTAGISSDDHGASPSGIHRETRWQNDQEVFIGWTATHAVHATVREIELAYRLVEQLAGIDGVDTSGPHWQVAHDNSAHSRARHSAVADGLAKARDYARAVDLDLGQLVMVADAPVAGGPMPLRRAMMAESNAQGGFEPGTQEVIVSVVMTFETANQAHADSGAEEHSSLFPNSQTD